MCVFYRGKTSMRWYAYIHPSTPFLVNGNLCCCSGRQAWILLPQKILDLAATSHNLWCVLLRMISLRPWEYFAEWELHPTVGAEQVSSDTVYVWYPDKHKIQSREGGQMPREHPDSAFSLLVFWEISTVKQRGWEINPAFRKSVRCFCFVWWRAC